MSWSEAWLLTVELAGDPASRVGAAVAGWSHPVSRESMTLADLFDVTVKVNSGRRTPKPYPRPWDEKPVRTSTSLPQAQIRAALAARGHGSGVEVVDEDRDGVGVLLEDVVEPVALGVHVVEP